MATLLDELVQVGRIPSGGDVFVVKLRTVEIGSVNNRLKRAFR
jgi:hypothetical protein